MSQSYLELLRDPKWQKKRLEVFSYARFRCQICGAKNRTLHCHHSYYIKGKKPWQYPTCSMICVCEDCHEKIHDKPATDDKASASKQGVPLKLAEESPPMSPEQSAVKFDAIFEMLGRL